MKIFEAKFILLKIELNYMINLKKSPSIEMMINKFSNKYRLLKLVEEDKM